MKTIISDCSLNVDCKNHVELRYYDLTELNFHNCTGCYSCWVHTPAICIFRDDAALVSFDFARSNQVVFVTEIIYGCYGVKLKKMLERLLPIMQPYIKQLDGETHHFQRNNIDKHASWYVYGSYSDKEKELFKTLVARTAKNLNYTTFDFKFFETLDELSKHLNKEVA